MSLRKFTPREATQCTYVARPRAAAVAIAGPARAVVALPKQDIVRDESYRRLVAGLPCSLCKREGQSQAAHPNFGKGMAIKADDRECFPLCVECHRRFDQGAMYPKAERRELEPLLGANTRTLLRRLAETDQKARRVVERVIGL